MPPHSTLNMYIRMYVRTLSTLPNVSMPSLLPVICTYIRSFLHPSLTHSEGIPLQSLNDEVADNPPIVHVHSRPVRVEYPGHTDVNAILVGISVEHGL